MIRLMGAGCLAGATALALGVPTTAFAQSTSGSEVAGGADSVGLLGTVTSTSKEALIVSAKSITVKATPMPGARMYSGVSGRVTSAAEFVVGDRVFIEGVSDGPDAILATDVGSMYDFIQFSVKSVDASSMVAVTSIGNLDLGGSLPDVGRIQHALQAGNNLTGIGWTDPRSGQLYLVLTESDHL
jgi:hypothetical protein